MCCVLCLCEAEFLRDTIKPWKLSFYFNKRLHAQVGMVQYTVYNSCWKCNRRPWIWAKPVYHWNTITQYHDLPLYNSSDVWSELSCRQAYHIWVDGYKGYEQFEFAWKMMVALNVNFSYLWFMESARKLIGPSWHDSWKGIWWRTHQ